MQEQAVSKQLDENIAWWKQQFSDCADIKMRPMCLGRDMSIRAFLSYIEVTGGKNMMEDSVLGKMLNRLNVMEPQQVYAVLQETDWEFRMSHLCTDVGSGRRDADR